MKIKEVFERIFGDFFGARKAVTALKKDVEATVTEDEEKTENEEQKGYFGLPLRSFTRNLLMVSPGGFRKVSVNVYNTRPSEKGDAVKVTYKFLEHDVKGQIEFLRSEQEFNMVCKPVRVVIPKVTTEARFGSIYEVAENKRIDVFIYQSSKGALTVFYRYVIGEEACGSCKYEDGLYYAKEV